MTRTGRSFPGHTQGWRSFHFKEHCAQNRVGWEPSHLFSKGKSCSGSTSPIFSRAFWVLSVFLQKPLARLQLFGSSSVTCSMAFALYRSPSFLLAWHISCGSPTTNRNVHMNGKSKCARMPTSAGWMADMGKCHTNNTGRPRKATRSNRNSSTEGHPPHISRKTILGSASLPLGQGTTSTVSNHSRGKIRISNSPRQHRVPYATDRA